MGSSNFLSGFADNGEAQWATGWGNSNTLLWPDMEGAWLFLSLVHKDGLHAMVEEVEA